MKKVLTLEQGIMEGTLSRMVEDLKIVEHESEEINGVLYAIGYEAPTGSGNFWSRRYHKIAIFGALNTLTFHDSNVIDATYTFEIKSVVSTAKATLNNIIRDMN